MKLTSLEGTGLGVERTELARLFLPFARKASVAEHGSWEAEVARRRRKIRRRYLMRLFLGRIPAFRRENAVVKREYSRAWAQSDFRDYDPGVPCESAAPWEWGDDRYFASDTGGARVRQRIVMAAVESLKPRTILEVGSGNGVNLLVLAGRFPNSALTGVDLTREGPAAALRLQSSPELPHSLRAFSPLPLLDAEAFRRVSFLQGSARALPFADRSFDLVITVLALEQMERLRDLALSEVARVAARHTLMIEPFRDVNARGWSRRYIVARDYFSGRLDELSEVGIEPILATADFPQEAHLKACAVMGRRRGT